MALRVLLTGGSGMVGRNLREHPAVAAWALLAPASAELDLTDAAATQHYVQQQRPDVIIHAAGRVGGIQANIARPVDFLADNARMGLNLVLAARTAGVPRLINLGSSCMYPREAPNPLGEDLILSGALEPTNEGYALAKIMTARLIDYARRENPALRWHTLIPCNLFGRHDKFDPAHSHLVPAVIHKIHRAKVEGRDEVNIWGDGQARREFMYAGDLADALVRAVESDAPMPDLMNLGPGADHSIDDYYEAVAQVIGWQGRFTHDPSKPVGMRRKLVSTDRQTTWGWQPRTPLNEGIALTYAYYLEHHAR